MSALGNQIRPDLEQRWNASLISRQLPVRVRVDKVECIKLSDTKAQCIATYRGVIDSRAGSSSTDRIDVNFDPSTGKAIFTAQAPA